MERINANFRSLENRLCFLANDPTVSPSEKSLLMPTIQKLLEAENEWKIFLLGAAKK